LLLLYTDGLTGAQKKGRSFGSECLDGVLQGSATKGADEVKAEILGQLEAFLDGENLQHDATLVVIERTT
jgi:serine phosphatase RsbU (regulator of sigma subunit)